MGNLIYCENGISILNINFYIRNYISFVFNNYSNYMEILKQKNFDLIVKVMYIDYCKMSGLNNDMPNINDLMHIDHQKLLCNNEIYLNCNYQQKAFLSNIKLGFGLDKYDNYGELEHNIYKQLSNSDLFYNGKIDIIFENSKISFDKFMSIYKEKIYLLKVDDNFLEDSSDEYDDLYENDNIDFTIVNDLKDIVFEMYGDNFYELNISNEKLLNDLSEFITMVSEVYNYEIVNVYDLLYMDYEIEPFLVYIDNVNSQIDLDIDDDKKMLITNLADRLISSYMLGNDKTFGVFFNILKISYIFSCSKRKKLNNLNDVDSVNIKLIETYLLRDNINCIELVEVLLLSEYDNVLFIVLNNYIDYRRIINKADVLNLLDIGVVENVKKLKKL